MAEYLIQLSPEMEWLYRTPSEFRAAIHSGVITPDAQIYHYASGQWLSIRMHPEFRRFEEIRAAEGPSRRPDWRRRQRRNVLRVIGDLYSRVSTTWISSLRRRQEPASLPPVLDPSRDADDPVPLLEGESRDRWTYFP